MAGQKNSFQNISLTGFMGSGKSTVGKILADRLCFKYMDIDKVIEDSERMKIPDIFKKKGEDYFRNIESEVIEKLYANRGCVFSCGGGVILRDENMKVIKSGSVVVFLSVSAENIKYRLKDALDRPLLQNKDRDKIIEEMLDFRMPLYIKYADVIIKADNCSPEEVATEIEKSLKN